MTNIIQFPQLKPYEGACEDCQEIIIKKKVLIEYAQDAEELYQIKKMTLWNRIFNWPYKKGIIND